MRGLDLEVPGEMCLAQPVFWALEITSNPRMPLGTVGVSHVVTLGRNAGRD